MSHDYLARRSVIDNRNLKEIFNQVTSELANTLTEAEWRDVSELSEITVMVSANNCEDITINVLFSQDGVNTLLTLSATAVTGAGFMRATFPVCAKFAKISLSVSYADAGTYTILALAAFCRDNTQLVVAGAKGGILQPISYIQNAVTGEAALKTHAFVTVDDGGGSYYDITGDSANGLDVDVTRLPAENANGLLIGSAVVPVKYAPISAAVSGNNTLVAAVTGKKIRVLALSLSATGAVSAKLQSGAGGTDLTGLRYMAANGGWELGFNKLGWFETEAGALLNLNLSGAVATGGCLVYVEV